MESLSCKLDVCEERISELVDLYEENKKEEGERCKFEGIKKIEGNVSYNKLVLYILKRSYRKREDRECVEIIFKEMND